MKRLTLAFGLVALAAVLAACSGAAAAPGSPDPGAPTGEVVSIVAKDMKFTTPQVSVKAGAPFSISFDNQEGLPHNVAISDASGASVSKGEIISSKKVTYAVQALAAGTYPFICEVHPDMKGTLTAQ